MRRERKNKSKKLAVPIVIFIAFLLTVWLLIIGIRSYLNHSSYFTIKKVVLNGILDKKIAADISKRFLYDNIFSLNMEEIKEELKIIYPQFYDLEILRSFPDKITVNIIVRNPVAQISQSGFYLVDAEGVIVSRVSTERSSDFMVISGLKVSKLSFGKKINLVQLKQALSLCADLKNILPKMNPLAGKIKNEQIEIQLSKYPSINVYLGGLEVRFYDNDLKGQIELFLKIWPSLEQKLEQVQYIDLRFKEPAVSFKE